MFRLKQIDKLLLQSFIGPFLAAFGVALFALIMQFFWTYIDEIAGKGVGVLILVELIFYLSMSLFPMALGIGILIASLMVMGNLAERYELSSFKSAGVSLLRVMRPLMVVGILTTLFSFFCSNYLIPYANLKFKTRLYDIRKSKPTLTITEGVFNEDFEGFVMRIGHKDNASGLLYKILIYDHKTGDPEQVNIISAERGTMRTTPNGRYFIMELEDGVQYQETAGNVGAYKNAPFMRNHFKYWRKVFDLGEFSVRRTDENLFKSNQTMLNTTELRVAIDSIDQRLVNRVEENSRDVSGYFVLTRKEEAVDDLTRMRREAAASGIPLKEELQQGRPGETTKPLEDSTKPGANPVPGVDIQALNKARKGRLDTSTSKAPGAFSKAVLDKDHTLHQVQDEFMSKVDTLTNLVYLVPPYDRNQVYDRALSSARSLQGLAENTVQSLNRLKESRVKHVYEYHAKFTVALVCLIFLFIGAPLGAVVRKGGFALPLLVAILFFTIFIVLNIAGRKMAESFVIPDWMSAWLAILVLGTVASVITLMSLRDRQIQTDRLTSFFKALGKRFSKKPAG